MFKFGLLSVSVVVLLFAGSTVALADDIQPPWWRGEWSTTTQWWEFGLNNNGTGDLSHDPGTGVKPDGPGELVQGPVGDPYPPGYLPSTELWIDPFDAWIEVVDQGQDSERWGIWPLSGVIDVTVDNHNPPNEKKIVWLQVTWRESTPGGHFDQPVVSPVSQLGHLTTAPELVGGVHEDLGAGWYESTYTWEIYPNPIDETFSIGGNIDVDEIIIDTWCIPEPTTLGLFLAGGLVFLRRRITSLK